MIRSMTGFGRGEYADEKRSMVCEIRTVNHRYSDVMVKMPRRYGFAEDMIKKAVKESIKRGKCEVSLLVESIAEDDLTINVSRVTAEQYFRCLKELKKEFPVTGEISVDLLASFPDVIKAMPSVEDEEEIKISISKALAEAIDNLTIMRVSEGEKLAADIWIRADAIREKLAAIEKRCPDLEKIYMEKLRGRIKELLDGQIAVDEDRILLEAAIFADKSGIDEEIVRLKSHLSQLDSILEQGEPSGKKLDFLVQEMNREANTIGSKANDLEITEYMLEIKSEVEKIREQVQNIE